MYVMAFKLAFMCVYGSTLEGRKYWVSFYAAMFSMSLNLSSCLKNTRWGFWAISIYIFTINVICLRSKFLYEDFLTYLSHL